MTVLVLMISSGDNPSSKSNDEPGTKIKLGPTISRGTLHIKPRIANPNSDGDGNKPVTEEQKLPIKDRIKDGKRDNEWCKSHDCGHDGGYNGNDDDHNHDGHKHHSHGSHDHHHDHDHNYHNDKHYHNHDDNNYYYYYSNDYSSNHATVILQLDYHGSSNHDNIRLEIGNDFDTTINFAGEPEDLVVTGLNLDDGEDFSVCLENEDSGKVNCVDTSIGIRTRHCTWISACLPNLLFLSLIAVPWRLSRLIIWIHFVL